MSLANLLSVVVYPLTGNYTCMEWGNCTLNGKLFQVALMPYQWSLGALAPVAIWGILLAIIWKTSHDMRLVGIVGIAVNALYIGFYPPAAQIGWFLLAVSAGVTLFWLFIVRPHGGTPS